MKNRRPGGRRGGCAVRVEDIVKPAIMAGCVALFLGWPMPAIRAAGAETAEITARQISNFRIGFSQRQFGKLEFQGGLELWSRHPRFGSMSGFRFTAPGSQFIGVLDTGYLFSGKLERDESGVVAGFSGFRLRSFAELENRDESSKWETDAEGLAVDGNRLLVSFERDHRITEYRADTELLNIRTIGDIPYLVPTRELRRNRGFETIAVAPRENPRAGLTVAVSEKSLDRDGNIFAAVLEGPGKGVFKVARHDEFDITDGAFLPDGDLLLLERSFSIASGVRMRLRRIPGGQLTKGAMADGEVLLAADMGYQIDNLEGMDVWRRGDGATMVSLVSDDNQSLLQRNLYLEFRLAD